MAVCSISFQYGRRMRRSAKRSWSTIRRGFTGSDMDETTFQPPPKALEAIMAETREIGFQSWCWPPVGALLRVMASLKPGRRPLEVGTGTGVGTCWLLDGMDATARLLTVDINPVTQAIARSHLGKDAKLTILTEDARATEQREPENSLDLVFTDGGVGNNVLLDEMLALFGPRR